MYTYISIFMYRYGYIYIYVNVYRERERKEKNRMSTTAVLSIYQYGVATMSRLLKFTGLFCKRAI